MEPTEENTLVREDGIVMGSLVRDKVTGLEGVATAFHYSMGRLPAIGVEPKSKDGKPTELTYFPKSRLEVVEF